MKIKRKALSVLSCLALIASSLPSTAVFVSADESNLTKATDEPIYVTISGKDGKTEKAVFANGNDITVELSTDGKTNVVKYVDSEGTNAKLTNVPFDADVFAGCHGDATSVGTAEKPVKITIDGAHLKTVYGGGLHESTVENVEITVKGEAELQWVCGGGANALIHDDCEEGAAGKAWVNGIDDVKNSPTQVKNATINFEAGNVTEAVYGGGQGLSNTANTTVNIKDGTIKYVCAGGSNGKTEEAQVNITGGTITDVASANRGTMERSDITVNGGTVTNLYIGATDTADVKTSDVTVASGKVTNMKPGKSKGTELTKDEFTGDDNYSFSVSPEATVDTYDSNLKDIKDTQNDYYYFRAKLNSGETDSTKISVASKLTCITQIRKGEKQSTNENINYHVGYIMANGYDVEAVDVDSEGHEKGTEEYTEWAATRIKCNGTDGDNSYLDTNYDVIYLFGGRHNNTQVVDNASVTLNGTTHVRYVFGGGWHESNTTNATVTIKNDAEVYRVQGGAASYLNYGASCGGDNGCTSWDEHGNKLDKECWKPSGGATAEEYASQAKAKVGTATVIIDGCKGTYSNPISAESEKTIVYGGGESYAYTGTSTVTVNSGTVDSVFAAGSNGCTDTAGLDIKGGTINMAASAKSGIVGKATVTVSGESTTVNDLVVGARANNHGQAKVEAADVTVSGGTVTKATYGDLDANGQTVTENESYTIVADGGHINQIQGAEGSEDYDLSNVDCNHDKYNAVAGTEKNFVDADCQKDGNWHYWQCENCKHWVAIKGYDKDATDKTLAEDVTDQDTLESDPQVDMEQVTITKGDDHHVWGDIQPVVPAACGKDGVKAHTYCTICGKVGIATLKEGKEDTSTNAEDYTIAPAEDDVKDLVIPGTPHKLETIPGKDATCSEPGLTPGSKCSICGEIVVAQTEIPMIPHTDSGKPGTAVEATCVKPGHTAGKVCSVCSKEYDQEEIPATGKHKFTTYVSDEDATCTEDGHETAICDDCKTAKDTRVKEGSALGHDAQPVEAKAATCTEDGIKEGYFKCAREDCGKYLKAETTGEGEDAQTVYVEVDAEEVIEPALGHHEVKIDAVAATCTATGLTEGLKCDRCNEVLVAQQIVPMVPHTVEKIEAVDATCEAWGLTEGTKCSVCGTILTAQTLTPPLGHDYDKNGVCTRDGAKDPSVTQPQQPTSGKDIVSVKVIKITQAKLTSLKVKSKAKNTINVNWKKVKNAKGYEVEVSKSSIFKPKAKVLTKTTTKLKLKIKNKKKLKSKKIYYVRARAYTTYKAADGSMRKAYSNWNYVLRKVKVK